MDITGRKLFVKAMMEEGVDTIFGYPGGMVTDLFDELYKQDDIHLVLSGSSRISFCLMNQSLLMSGKHQVNIILFI